MSDPINRLTAALTGRYEIGDAIGRGGMATVYLAQDVRHGRRVAVKVLQEGQDPAVSDARFQHEIQIAAQLSHPHILTLHDSGEAEGLRYYVMPYVAGETLRETLDREERLVPDETVRLGAQIAEALDYAHRTGIVHRDIKPENIMMHEGHAMIADFGIASGKATLDQSLTVTGSVLGTPAYLSPEQVNGDPVDGRSDLYSLACVLFECVTGDLPFSGTALSMIAQRVTSEPPSASSFRSDVPAGLSTAIRRAMATGAEGRFATGREFAEALRQRESAPTATSDRPGVVVLPFTNLSPDPDNEFFSDGLTEEIIFDLSSVKGLSVISRTSSMQLKGTTKDVRTIGRELGVRYVLEGGVRKAGERLRISAKLVDAAADESIWTERFDGSIDEVFEVQERVAREIAAALDVTLTSEEDRRLSEHPVGDIHGFELFLQARQEIRRYGSGIARGIALIEKGLELGGDPYLLGALRARAELEKVRSGLVQDLSALDKAEATAQELLEDGPERVHSHAYGILGLAAYERGEAARAVRYFLESLERDPNDVDYLFFLGITYQMANRSPQALEVARRAVACDPLSPNSWMLACASRWFVNRANEGVANGLRSVELDPDHGIARWCLAYNLALCGQWDEARAHAEHLEREMPEMIYTDQIRGLIAAHQGRTAEALALMEGVAPLDHHHQFHLAEVYAVAGAHEVALDMLEESVEGFTPIGFIREYCPFIEPLRDHPRFAAILQKAEAVAAAFNPALA